MTRPMDYVPIIPGTDADPVRDLEGVQQRAVQLSAEDIEQLGQLNAVPGKVEVVRPATDDERLAKVEASLALLWKAIAALESKIGVR